MRNPGRQEKSQGTPKKVEACTAPSRGFSLFCPVPAFLGSSFIPLPGLCLLCLARSESLGGAKILKVSNAEGSQKLKEKTRESTSQVDAADCGEILDSCLIRTFRPFRGSCLSLSAFALIRVICGQLLM